MKHVSDCSRRPGALRIPATVGLIACLLAVPFESSVKSAEKAPAPRCCDWPIRFSTYSITGRTLPEIRRALDAVAASGSHGGQHYGYTRWRFRLPSTKAPACEPGALTIAADIQVVLPEVENLEALSLSDRDKWLQYVEALRAHEMEHVRIIDDGLDAMQVAIAALPSCDQAVTTVQMLERTIHQVNRQLDTSTNHGQNGEVVFPN